MLDFLLTLVLKVLNEVVMISNITHFDVGIGDTFSGVTESKAVVKTVGLLFSDQSRIPNLIGENGPIIDGLLYTSILLPTILSTLIVAVEK